MGFKKIFLKFRKSIELDPSSDLVEAKPKPLSNYDTAADPDEYDARQGGEVGREFGDHMALEGKTSHIPTVIVAMYAAILAWSHFTAWATGCGVWTIPCYYIVGMIAFYAWHRLAHSEAYHSFCKKRPGTQFNTLKNFHGNVDKKVLITPILKANFSYPNIF